MLVTKKAKSVINDSQQGLNFVTNSETVTNITETVCAVFCNRNRIFQSPKSEKYKENLLFSLSIAKLVLLQRVNAFIFNSEFKRRVSNE